MIISTLISKDCIEKPIPNLSFAAADAISIMYKLGINKGIIEIRCDLELTESIYDFINLIANDYIIVGIAEISKYEFPRNEWTISPIEGKKLIPVEEILNKISAQFESAGFESINDYIGYTFKRAFIYKNEVSQPIISMMHSCNG